MKIRGKEIPAWAVKWGLIVLFGILALAYFRYAKDSWKPWESEPQPASQPREPKEIRTIERILIPGPERVRVIEKIQYVDKIPGALTPATMQDNSAHVIASAKIPPSPAGGTASAILRTGPDGVGVGSLEWKPADPPFFAIQKEFGVRGGMGTGGLVLGELYARPVRVGPVTVEIRGFGKRDDRSGSDFGAAILGDMRF
jgi:hypothetical protein